jgi:hypothetical protein
MEHIFNIQPISPYRKISVEQELFNSTPFNITSSTDFITKLISKARTGGEYDTGLLNILEMHILKENPSTNAVDQAFVAIQGLAEARAGETNHD